MKAATFDSKPELINCKFQSTPPVKAATVGGIAVVGGIAISIHAAREGGDGTILK